MLPSTKQKDEIPFPYCPGWGGCRSGGDRGGCVQLLVATCPYFLELDFGPEKFC